MVKNFSGIIRWLGCRLKAKASAPQIFRSQKYRAHRAEYRAAKANKKGWHECQPFKISGLPSHSLKAKAGRDDWI
jgi:hypothetical protein